MMVGQDVGSFVQLSTISRRTALSWSGELLTKAEIIAKPMDDMVDTIIGKTIFSSHKLFSKSTGTPLWML